MIGPNVCDNCGHRGAWGPGWVQFGALGDAGDEVARLCSPGCVAESTEEELAGLVERRRRGAPVGALVPLREYREHGQEALPLDFSGEEQG